MSKEHYNSRLKENARELRNEMTKAEACLWKYALRAKMMKGYSFRRQRPILNYIVDFVCDKLKLIIEVDGNSHIMGNNAERDRIRQTDLENAGYVVLRFSNMSVLQDMQGVRAALENWIEQKEIEAD